MRLTICRLSSLSIATVLAAGSLFASQPELAGSEMAVTSSYNSTAQSEIMKALKDIQFRAGNLSHEAQTLESMTRGTGSSWQGQALQLHLAREHINAIGDRLAFLQAVKHTGSPLQQRAIEHIVPIAMEVANRTQAAILHLNENRTHLFAPQYVDHVKALAARSDYMKESVDTFLELAGAQQKVQHIEDRLEQRLS